MPPSSHLRHIPLACKPPEHAKDWEDVKKAISFVLPRDVRRIQEAAKGMKITSRDNIYKALSGIAFMEYHLSGMAIPLQDNLTPSGLISTANKHLAQVLRGHSGYHYAANHISFIESSVGIATLVLTRGPSNSEESIVNNWEAALDYLRTTMDQVLAEDFQFNSPVGMEDGCEFLYGRAGLLYALLYIRKAIYGKPQQEMARLLGLASEANLSILVDAIIIRGKHGAFLLSSDAGMNNPHHLPPLMWTWRGKHYLGSAHGVAGILQILLSCPVSVIQKHLPEIFSAISWLIDRQDDTGNWASKFPTPKGGDNERVQWCLGAPGIVILLSTALRLLHDHEGMIATEGIEGKLCHSLRIGADVVYNTGLSRKGVGLCHGVAGSVYALLAVSDALDTSSDRQFFSKAAHLAFLATSHEDMTSSGEMVVPDHPWSLYEGLAGMCCAWAEVLCHLDSNGPRRTASGFPAYNDIAVPNDLYPVRRISML